MPLDRGLPTGVKQDFRPGCRARTRVSPAARRRDDPAAVCVHREGHADHAAVPAGKPRPVRAPARVRAHHDDPAVTGALRALKAGPLRRQPVARHDPVHAPAADGRRTPRARRAVRQRRDPAISKGWPPGRQCPVACRDRRVTGFATAPTRPGTRVQPAARVRARDLRCRRDRLHGEPSRSGGRASKVCFSSGSCPTLPSGFRSQASRAQAGVPAREHALPCPARPCRR